jgi:hypothetical protein
MSRLCPLNYTDSLAASRLLDFRKRISKNPSLDQRLKLLERVGAIPGCQNFDKKKLTSWFGRRRSSKVSDMKVKAEAELSTRSIRECFI